MAGAEYKWSEASRAVWVATRREAKLSYQQLADRLKWTRDEVVALEAGRRRIKAIDMMRLARVVGMSGDTMYRRIMNWRGSPSEPAR